MAFPGALWPSAALALSCSASAALALSGDQPWCSALMLSGDHPPLALSGDQPLWSSAILLSHDPIGVHTSFGVSGAKCFPAPGEYFGAQLLGNWLLRRSVTPVFGRSGAMALGSQLPPPFSARPLPDSTPGSLMLHHSSAWPLWPSALGCGARSPGHLACPVLCTLVLDCCAWPLR